MWHLGACCRQLIDSNSDYLVDAICRDMSRSASSSFPSSSSSANAGHDGQRRWRRVTTARVQHKSNKKRHEALPACDRDQHLSCHTNKGYPSRMPRAIATTDEKDKKIAGRVQTISIRTLAKVRKEVLEKCQGRANV